jgi:predicted RNA-binding Zn-ribbon protein involved in translation (DUF1610 family)
MLADMKSKDAEIDQLRAATQSTCVWRVEDGEYGGVHECSNCHMELVFDDAGAEESGYKFCPGCGAKIVKFERGDQPAQQEG